MNFRINRDITVFGHTVRVNVIPVTLVLIATLVILYLAFGR